MTTGRINQVAITFRPQCIPRTSARNGRAPRAPRKARGSPERKQSASTRRYRTANEGPRDNKRNHRTREHADSIDAPTRTETPRRWTTDREESADARTMSPNAGDAGERRGNRDRDENESVYRNRVSNAGTHPSPAAESRGGRSNETDTAAAVRRP